MQAFTSFYFSMVPMLMQYIRDVMLQVATAHAPDLLSLMDNPDLKPLLGSIAVSTLTDEVAL